ncbi:hypothetical protein [Kribbella sp. NBC_00359]|uniref:hypothetical protein n=1 Tax=Kribbella sp. NBC_00359 TaxID=2975966 RepID=UPI002E1C55EE
MRQSLSETPRVATQARGGRSTALLAVVLSIVLAAAAIADQAGSRTLIDHATTAYASSGKQPSAGLLYGLVYGVAVVDALLWLLVVGVARSNRRIAASLGVLVVLLTAGLAALLLASSEYGVRIFPALWGTLALLPAVAGAVAVALLFRRD